MNAVTLLNAIEAYLQPLVASENGLLELSGTVDETLAALAHAPHRWRVLLQWQRENAQGITATSVELRFLLIVQQAKGLDLSSGADASKDRAGDPSLLARANQARGWIRALRFQHPELDGTGPKLRDAYWLTDPRLPTRQIATEFSYLMGLDAVNPVTVILP